MSDQAARLERVRAALERAETATGLRPVDWSSRVAPAAAEAAPPVTLPADASWIPVPDALAPLLPHGAVRRGSTLVVGGSTSLLLQTAAALAAGGAWTALVAHPDLGLAAALDVGLDPARCVLVPDPGPAAGEVLGAIVDGFDVVAVGACTALDDRDRRGLSQRIRHRGAVLLSTMPWPGSEVTWNVSARAGVGLSSHGRLTAERLTVESSGRGLGAGRQVELEFARDGGRGTLVAATSTRAVVPVPARRVS